MSEKDRLVAAWEQETPVTLKVLAAFPPEQAELKPHPRSRSARELAWTFVFEAYGGAQTVDGELKYPPVGMPASAPAAWDGIVREVERGFRRLLDKLRAASEAQLETTVQTVTGTTRRRDFLWYILYDMIHHRGQFSVYLRMAGGKVPSIYGPTADERPGRSSP